MLLVLDATVGQNGLAQAREFMGVAGVNGIVLTKLDGTAKGGIAVAIAHDLKLPIRYVGVGEGIDDLVPFSPEEYVDALFEESGRHARVGPRAEGGIGQRMDDVRAAAQGHRARRTRAATPVRTRWLARSSSTTDGVIVGRGSHRRGGRPPRGGDRAAGRGRTGEAARRSTARSSRARTRGARARARRS